MDRPKRPPLDRTTPIRSWAALLGIAPADGAPAADGAAPPPTPLDDVIARSVDLAYRVIDDYVRQGQRAAERLGARDLSAGALASDLQDASARLVHYASDATTLWLDFLRVASGAARPGAPAAAPDATPAAAAAPATAAEGGEALGVAIDVVAPGPTEVSLDLRPGATGATLVVHALRAVEPGKPPLADVAVVPPDGGPPRIRVRVPSGQPAGAYHGLVLDAATNRPLGALTVRVIDG
jgi:hypothetical protein